MSIRDSVFFFFSYFQILLNSIQGFHQLFLDRFNHKQDQFTVKYLLYSRNKIRFRILINMEMLLRGLCVGLCEINPKNNYHY